MGAFSTAELVWIGVSVLLLGMAKGGFPIGSVALPLLVLVWPTGEDPTRRAVAFILPLLCMMDVTALVFYRRHVQWRHITPLFPAMIVGVAVASILFVSDTTGIVAVSDRALKLCIGGIGLLFVAHQAFRKKILKKLERTRTTSPLVASIFGFFSGIASTLAHAGGPPFQMYLLPRGLPKMAYAATTVAFFFVLNLVKVPPFALAGRLDAPTLILGAALLPIVPIGVGLGYLLVRWMNPKHYVGFIYTILFATSGLLIVKALNG